MTSNVVSQAQLVPTATVGFADIVGFGIDGVKILRNGASQPFEAIEAFGYDQKWRVKNHVRLLCDMDGNKEADLVGFGHQGVFVSLNNGNNTFTPMELVLKHFGYDAGGWRVQKHVRFAADIRKVGRCDIIGFGDRGVSVSLNSDGHSFSIPRIILNDFGYDQGWRIEKHLRFLAPVSKNGLQDIVGFGEDSVLIARNNGDGTFAPAKKVLNHFCSGQGWHIGTHPRVLADLMGNGWVDIIGFSSEGVYVSMNDGNGNFGTPSRVIANFGTQEGWGENYPRFIANLRRTKLADIIGFGDAGVYVASNNGDGTFQPARVVLENFGTKQGWGWGDNYPRFVVDLTGDGCADIIGFGKDYVSVSISDCNGRFGAEQKLTRAFAYNGGRWDIDYTVRYLVNLHKDSRQVS